ncbi:LCP family protein [Butyrivibrio fibrisolvens]|uniref:LCP family protein n=1 Tax=Butyrivibrio fibrisolvens TaxID=831 RepID=UPI0004285C2A|nr:LCP family protein [Butyrivibrio fibrisolvens]
MHRKMRKFNKDTSPLKEDGLVIDYDMGDIMLDRRPGKFVNPEIEFEDINSHGYRSMDSDDVDEWVSSNRNAIRSSRTGSYVSNRQLYDSTIDNLSLYYKEKPKEEKPRKTALEQLAEIRPDSPPPKPFANRAEEVRYQFSEKKRREEIRKFAQERQREYSIKKQKDEDRRRTEELKKIFDLEDGDETLEPSYEDLKKRVKSSKVDDTNVFFAKVSSENRALKESRDNKDHYKESIKASYKDSHKEYYKEADTKKSREYDEEDDDFINTSDGFDPSKIKSRGSVKTQEYHHSHRHHHSKARRALRIIRNTILILLAVTVGLAGIGYGAYRLMEYTGGLSLYNRTQDQAPDLSQAPLYEAVNVGDDQMPLTASASSWQPGWIRYDGKTYAYNSNLLTFLVLGIDSMDKVHEGEDGISGGQSDAMFFLVLDPDSKEIKIVAINRNAMTDIDVYNEEGIYVGTGEAQICLQHGFGNGLEQSCERTVKTVRNLFHELPINGYISINMGAIPTVNDTVGGVTLKVMYSLPAAGQYRSLRKGDTVTLTGDDAYWYTQHRDITVDYSANERLERQLQYLIEFVPALQERVKEDPKSIASIYSALSPYMVTDIGLNEAVYLGTEAAEYSFDSANIYQMKGESIIGRSGFEEFIYDEDELYDLIIDVFYTEVDA